MIGVWGTQVNDHVFSSEACLASQRQETVPTGLLEASPFIMPIIFPLGCRTALTHTRPLKQLHLHQAKDFILSFPGVHLEFGKRSYDEKPMENQMVYLSQKDGQR